jgi:hypothetical protein
MSKTLQVPFTVLIDSAESQPFQFVGHKANSRHNYRPLIVPTTVVSLGRYPESNGDYSLLGHVGEVAIERKSIDDLQGTILGWETEFHKQKNSKARRQRFEHELSRLNDMEAAIVIVEGQRCCCLSTCQQWGDKTAQENALILHHSIIAYQQDYPRVQWGFYWDRQSAERAALYYLSRFWRNKHERRKSRSAAASVRPDTDSADGGAAS